MVIKGFDDACWNGDRGEEDDRDPVEHAYGPKIPNANGFSHRPFPPDMKPEAGMR